MSNCIRVFLFVTSVFFIPNLAFAQDADAGTPESAEPDGGADAGALTPVGACFAACERLAASLPEDDETDGNTLMARCESELPECSALDHTVRESLPSFCDRVVGRHRSGVEAYEHHAEPPPAFCVLPTGTDADSGRHRCGCAPGYYPLRVSRERSSDRLRSLHVPAGHAVFVCYDPTATSGAPGSGGERMAALERAVTDASAALERLCTPHAGESLPDACARAREDFLAAGSTAGPVDLGPVMHALEGLQANAEHQQAVIDRMIEDDHDRDVTLDQHHHEIETLSRRLDALSECMAYGHAHELDVNVEVQNPDGTTHLETTHVTCERILANATEPMLRQAREAAREAVSHLTVDAGHAFAWLQAYGLVEFNRLTYGNVDYGNVWQVGGEFTVGVGLGDNWNFHGGLGVGYSGPDIRGATNVGGNLRIGFGVFPIPELMLGFGFMATHRFLPDVFSAESIYGAYLDGTIRFLPHADWTPILTIRLMGGASPRQAGRGWDVQPNGAIEVAFGVAHF